VSGGRHPTPASERAVAFSARLAELGVRARKLPQSAEHLTKSTSLAREALDQVAVQYDELCAAEEEIREQVDQLAFAAAELEQERERYRELFDAFPVPQLVTDSETTIHQVNRAASQLLRLDPHRLVGERLCLFVMDPDTVLAAVPRHRRESEPQAVVFVPAEGPVISATLRGKRMGDSMILWTADETRERTSIPPPAHQARAWEVSVALRSKEEELEAERRLRIDLQRASSAKDQSIAALSHELLGPLNIVRGWTTLLKEGKLSTGAAAKALRVIERNVHNQVLLVHTLSDISRIMTGKVELALVPVDLAEVTSEVVEGVRPASAERGISLAERRRGDCTVRGDRLRLTQVFQNLIGNALKFTPRGGRVEVEVRRTGKSVVACVEDDGPGIPSDQLSLVFECFHQVCDRARSQEGLGLGLFLVREIVKLHGGEVRASGGAARGARFEVTLPAA